MDLGYMAVYEIMKVMFFSKIICDIDSLGINSFKYSKTCVKRPLKNRQNKDQNEKKSESNAY